MSVARSTFPWRLRDHEHDLAGDDDVELAAERILDAAAQLFAEQASRHRHGHRGPSGRVLARHAYRYFDNRRALQFAFAHREALRIVESVGNAIQQIEDPTERAVEAVVGAIHEVRAKPSLLAWVAPGKTGEVNEILRESPLIEAFTARFVGEREDFPDLDLARWVLRCDRVVPRRAGHRRGRGAAHDRALPGPAPERSLTSAWRSSGVPSSGRNYPFQVHDRRVAHIDDPAFCQTLECCHDRSIRSVPECGQFPTRRIRRGCERAPTSSNPAPRPVWS